MEEFKNVRTVWDGCRGGIVTEDVIFRCGWISKYVDEFGQK